MIDRNHQRGVGLGRRRWVALSIALLVGTFLFGSISVFGLIDRVGLAAAQPMATQSVAAQPGLQPNPPSIGSQRHVEELEFNSLNLRAGSTRPQPVSTPDDWGEGSRPTSPAKVISQRPDGAASRGSSKSQHHAVAF